MSIGDEVIRSRLAESTRVKALVAMDDDVDREMVEALMTSDTASVSVIDYFDVDNDLKAKDESGEVLMVVCDEFSGAVADFVRVAHQAHPSRPILLLSAGGSNGYVRQAFDAGVDDVVVVPRHADAEQVREASRELAFTIEKALARKQGGTGAAREALGRMICVLGLKGGSGKTLVAANLGVALASAGRSVAIVDLDLEFGDMGLAMGLRPELTLYDLVCSGGALDGEKLGDFLVTHSSGAQVLLSPVRPDHAALVTPEYLRQVQRVLRETHEFVVVDTPPSFTPEVIATVDASTDIVMVTTRDSLALKNTKLALETLERMEYDRRRIHVVLNRANSDVGIDREDLLAILGTDVDVQVPSHREITRAVNRGEPIALQRHTEPGKIFAQLAKLYTENGSAPRGEPSSPNTSRRRLFRRSR